MYVEANCCILQINMGVKCLERADRASMFGFTFRGERVKSCCYNQEFLRLSFIPLTGKIYEWINDYRQDALSVKWLKS